MKKSHILGVLLSTALLLPAGEAFARKGGDGMKRMAKEMNLTAEQKEKFQELRKEGREEDKKHRDAMKAAREDLEKALRGNASEKELREKFAKLEKLQSEFAKFRFEKILSIRAILTPEQRAKFRGMMGDHHEGKEWKRKKRDRDEE